MPLPHCAPVTLYPKVRYTASDVRLPLHRSIILFLHTGQWSRVERTFKPIFPCQPGYDDARYECTTIYDRAEMTRLKQLDPN